MAIVLEERFGQVVGKPALQAELDRAAAETRAPARLRALFTSLDNDADMIAECLIRPRLAEDRLRARVSTDDQIQGPFRAVAQEEYARVRGSSDPAMAPSATYNEQASDSLKTRAAQRERGSRSGSEVGSFSEDEDGYYARVVRWEGTAARVGTLRWPKRTFEDWWREQRSEVEPRASVVGSMTGDLQLPKILTNGCLDQTWRPMPARYATYGLVGVWTGAELLMWGGEGTVQGDIRGFRYDLALDRWSPMTTTGAPAYRIRHAGVWSGEELLVWGGCSDAGTNCTNNKLLNTGGRYNPASDTWTAMTTAGAPLGRASHTAVWTGSKLVIWGGQEIGACGPPSNYGCRSNSGGVYDPITDSWTATASSGLSARLGHTATWTGSRMAVFGGCSGQVEGTGSLFDPVQNNWTAMPFAAARCNHSAIWTGTRLVVWGGVGSSSTNVNTGARYTPGAPQWDATTTTNAPSGRQGHVAVWTGSSMVVWGGNGPSNEYTATGGRYDPVLDLWNATPVGATGAPSPRSRALGLWTGSEVLVWGGIGNAADTGATGARYDPAANAWTTMSALGTIPPSGRGSAGIVWTGAEAVVFGGTNGIPLGDGFRYDPLVDTWIPVPTTGAPAPRREPVMAWTGEEVLVWGGTDTGGTLNTGALLDLDTDTWRAMSTVDAPPSGVGVWAGSKLAVWGGTAVTGPSDQGALFDPAANDWEPLPTAGAPTPRYGHSLIWTGSQLAVWAGNSSLGSTNTGAKLLLGAPNWSPTSVINAPPARSGHVAGWVENKMLIWGGFGLSDGASYSPATDQWVPFDSTNAPSAREATMSGTNARELIIWGGYDSSTGQYKGSGGRYNACGNIWLPINSTGAPTPRAFAAATWTGEEFLIWGSNLGQDDGGLYCVRPVPCPPLFADSFESGDPLRWSSYSE